MDRLRTTIATLTTAVVLQMCPASASEHSCGTSEVTVFGASPELADVICTVAEQAAVLFEQCSIPPLARPIRIDLVDEMVEGCVGVYHCGEDTIELLQPSLMEKIRTPESVFSHLSPAAYFDSVIIHELAHAASEGIACPFEDCTVASEYIAYSMQVMSLGEKGQKTFEENAAVDKRISSDELNVFILYMAPNVFAKKAWAHLSQRADPCMYIGQLVDGTILLDRERF